MDAFTVQDRVAAALAPLDADVTTGEPKTGADGKIRRTRSEEHTSELQSHA